jgi:hypothetical protein
MAASIAVRPRRSTATPICEASGWEVAIMARAPYTAGDQVAENP